MSTNCRLYTTPTKARLLLCRFNAATASVTSTQSSSTSGSLLSGGTDFLHPPCLQICVNAVELSRYHLPNATLTASSHCKEWRGMSVRSWRKSTFTETGDRSAPTYPLQSAAFALSRSLYQFPASVAAPGTSTFPSSWKSGTHLSLWEVAVDFQRTGPLVTSEADQILAAQHLGAGLTRLAGTCMKLTRSPQNDPQARFSRPTQARRPGMKPTHCMQKRSFFSSCSAGKLERSSTCTYRTQFPKARP